MEKKTIRPLFIEDSDLPGELLGNGISRKVITYDDRVMLVKVAFEKGSIGTIHQHYHTQISCIEKGSFEVSINGEKKLMHADGSFHVPPHAPHGVLCLEEGVLIDIFSPLREDFILP